MFIQYKSFFRDVGSWSTLSFVPLLLSNPILISEKFKNLLSVSFSICLKNLKQRHNILGV